MKRLRSLLALALLAAPLSAAAQERDAPPPAWRQPGEHPAAFEILLRHGDELRLTREQAMRLQEIGRRLEERNRPLRERLRRERQEFVAERRAQVRRLSPHQRRDTLVRLRGEHLRRHPRRIPPGMLPLVREMHANTRRAMEEAQTVLTPEQKARARVLVRERREEARRRMEARRGREAPPFRHPRGS